MGKSFKDKDWADRDEQLNPEFFDASTTVFVEETAISDLPFSISGNEKQEKEEVTEEIEAPTVAVRFDGEGFAEPVDDEAEAVETGPLEAMPLPYKMGVTAWGSAFSEVHTRAHNLENHSKVTAIRYIQSGSSKKVSCLPSVCDFLADVQIVARKVLSPTLYRLWKKVYYEDFGKNADRLPESVQMAIQQRCGVAWKKAGLLPFHLYWHIRTPEHKLCAVSLAVLHDKNEDRNKRRRAARKARPVISTLTVAA